MPWLRRRPPAGEPGAEAAFALGDLRSDVVEVRLRIPRQMAASLQAGVPCREVRIERVGDDQVALLLSAEQP